MSELMTLLLAVLLLLLVLTNNGKVDVRDLYTGPIEGVVEEKLDDDRIDFIYDGNVFILPHDLWLKVEEGDTVYVGNPNSLGDERLVNR